MAETPSTFELKLGAEAPDFSLPDGSGKVVRLSDRDSGPFVVFFACNHCPYVVHLAAAVGELARETKERGVSFYAISSNDVENYPDDAPAKMVRFAREFGWDFPYLYDESQEVAKAYRAACTPDFFLFGASGRLAYAGQFDDSRPGNGKAVTGNDLRGAIACVLAGRSIDFPSTPSTGCNIKWKAGNAPPYYG